MCSTCQGRQWLSVVPSVSQRSFAAYYRKQTALVPGEVHPGICPGSSFDALKSLLTILRRVTRVAAK